LFLQTPDSESIANRAIDLRGGPRYNCGVVHLTSVRSRLNPKPAKRKHLKTASPLLSALAARQTGALSSTQDALLRCYVALDAMRRGNGSRSLFAVLGQHLIMAINLCKQGYRTDRFPDIRAAQQGLLRLRQQAPDDWSLDEEAYHALRIALCVFEEQLLQAPTAQVVQARSDMLMLLNTTRRAA
jgi:hypothetical protein